jgi:hypothetical protein
MNQSMYFYCLWSRREEREESYGWYDLQTLGKGLGKIYIYLSQNLRLPLTDQRPVTRRGTWAAKRTEVDSTWPLETHIYRQG